MKLESKVIHAAIHKGVRKAFEHHEWLMFGRWAREAFEYFLIANVAEEIRNGLGDDYFVRLGHPNEQILEHAESRRPGTVDVVFFKGKIPVFAMEMRCGGLDGIADFCNLKEERDRIEGLMESSSIEYGAIGIFEGHGKEEQQLADSRTKELLDGLKKKFNEGSDQVEWKLKSKRAQKSESTQASISVVAKRRD